MFWSELLRTQLQQRVSQEKDHLQAQWRTWSQVALAEAAQQGIHVSAAASPLACCEGGTAPRHLSHLTSPCEIECKCQGWNSKQFCWKIKLDLFLTSHIRVRWKWIKDLTIRITTIELVWVICCWVTSYSHTKWLKTHAFSSPWVRNLGGP